ncbi:anoctamin-5-like [Musca vetustissima]|uniref:anoctamin-5-like n=1 Tax=Musca vetustissima TaxID=27455 RepID=UPI002AB641DA|nr:anoctamin-5-like [Musca vetustissima]
MKDLLYERAIRDPADKRRSFKDGVREVDFVLAYNSADRSEDHIKKRKIFETNLAKEGLQLERDKALSVHFVLIHAPKEVLYRYAEILKIKMPMKMIPGQNRIYENDKHNPDEEFTHNLKKNRIYSEFQRKYECLFDSELPNFFDSGTRINIINFILERQRFVEGEETPDNLGIEKLLADGVYESAYSLHDDVERQVLLKDWANIKMWIHQQPLDAIKEYFGARIAIYFAWLGFYTHMLIPISIIGILQFIYGFITRRSDPISREICNTNKTTLMCPQCDRNCDYWELKDTCGAAKANYLIDNNMTVAFAFIISIWAVVYLELWKRYSANLIHRWGLTDYTQEVEHPRPQYLEMIRKNRKLADRIKDKSGHNLIEAEIPFWSVKFSACFASYSVAVLSVCVSIIAILSMIIYRMALKASHSFLGDETSTTYKIMAQPITAGCIDLTIITILHYAYSYLAEILTNREYCRTQTEYDESLTLKIYIFQFVNYYFSLFYIAFLKGKFVGYPMKYNRIFGFRQQECNPGGCLMELCIQLVIITVGKQLMNAIVENLLPLLKKKWKEVQNKKRESVKNFVSDNQWNEDYPLQPWTSRLLFAEYLEMVMQFGFITLFGVAFPLAPLLALINNAIEVRTDAVKMLKFIRRPVAQRASNIGVWFGIMTVITRLAVATCAMIIAFSTNLIPKIVYKYATHDDELQGYLNFTLAYFNTSDFPQPPNFGYSKYGNVTLCRYIEFRNPPGGEFPYKRPIVYWKILMARLAFIVIFQNVIGGLQTIIAWAIPDVSAKLVKRIKHENFLLREYIIECEKRQVIERNADEIISWVVNMAPESDTSLSDTSDDSSTYAESVEETSL